MIEKTIEQMVAELRRRLQRRGRLRIAVFDGKRYSKYSGAHLRAIRAARGVGRPPRIRLA